MKRKVLSLFVVVILLLTMSVPVFADAVPYGSTVYAGELYIVSSMNCVSSSGSSNLLGHSFLIYHNTTSTAQTFGNLNVPAGLEITIGTSGVEVYDGVWYCLEAFYHRENGSYEYNYYMGMSLSLIDLVQVSNVILNWEEYDLWTNNCAHFASTVWNTVSDIDFYVNTPQELIFDISEVSDAVNYDITSPGNPVYYDRGMLIRRPEG